MIKIIRHYSCWGGLALALIGALHSGNSVYQTAKTNQLISQLNQGKDINADLRNTAVPELQLARATYLKNKQRFTEAQAILSQIINQSNQQMQTVGRYNLGNTYLVQAIALAESLQINEAIALATLAKQAYRQALALDSQYWDAKYNLEVAMRLLPEMDRIIEEQDEPAPQEKVKLWATVPGFPRGLP